jgi:hypothetical protein
MKAGIEFVPFERLMVMSPEQRVSLIVKHVKNNSIMITDGKLDVEEEAKLIETTMRQISKKFTGIEVASIETGDLRKNQPLNFMRDKISELISGKKRGITIVGPAKLVKKIKKKPDRISLLMK